MAKKGGTRHWARITVPPALSIPERKKKKWIAGPIPGPHRRRNSVSLTVLLRDQLKLVGNSSEAERVVKRGEVLVDGKIVREEKRPVGLMDVVSIPAEGKHYRIEIKGKKLVPKEIGKGDRKLCKVVGKHVVKGGKRNIALHDGRVIGEKDGAEINDTVVLLVPSGKVERVIKLSQGASCLVTAGKHKGKIAIFEEVVKKERAKKEAKLRFGEETLVTPLKYVFAVDESFIKG
jgi:small subunit ribosomal protein S4e